MVYPVIRGVIRSDEAIDLDEAVIHLKDCEPCGINVKRPHDVIVRIGEIEILTRTFVKEWGTSFWYCVDKNLAFPYASSKEDIHLL